MLLINYNNINSNIILIVILENNIDIEYVYKLVNLKNVYIVDYTNSWIDSDRLCIQMEFYEYDLQNIIELKNKFDSSLIPIDFYISCNLFQEILECVQYLHSRDPPIIHGNLKPSNILIKNSKTNGRYVKLCDFGLTVNRKQKIMLYTSGSRPKFSTTHTGSRITLKHQDIIFEKSYNTKEDIYNVGNIGHKLFRIDNNPSNLLDIIRCVIKL